MKNNIEKYNYYRDIIIKKSEDYINLILYNKPSIFYFIHNNGRIEKCNINKIYYNFEFKIYYTGDTYTKLDVEKIKAISENDILFKKDRIYFNYDGDYPSNSISYKTLYENDNICFDINKANKISNDIKEKDKKEKEFLLLNTKDKNYNYETNGYKFLGRLNEWKFPIDEKDHPEYANCSKLKHILVNTEHIHNEITVSCPICKIYWIYDNGD